MRPVPVRTRDAGFGAPASADASLLSTHTVLRNTYLLLSMTLLFSAAMAGLSMAIGFRGLPAHGLIMLVGMLGLMFWVNAARNSSTGIVAVFAFTGFIGFMVGPLLSFYVQAIPNGSQLVLMALGGTGAIFMGLSAYVLTTRKDFSFMGGFLMAGLIAIVLLSVGTLIASMFGVQVQMLSLAISAAAMLLFSAMILFDTSRIIHGGETNYIMATVALYLDIYNIFMSLLHLLGFAASDD
ncbi:MAG: Bax inhibitor-1/YccA family protein [Nevskiales bacterium]|nr:Bax inhibitor-1/YccA family protein [Nevskiales bacterium]